MAKYIQRRPPEMKEDTRETLRETLEYLDYLKDQLNWILDVYGKRLASAPEISGNQATIGKRYEPHD